MSTFVKHTGALLTLILLVGLWGYNLFSNVKVEPLSQGTLAITLQSVNEKESINKEEYMIKGVQPGLRWVGIANVGSGCKMQHDPLKLEISSRDTAFVSLKVKCPTKRTSPNPMIFIYDSLKQAEVYEINREEKALERRNGIDISGETPSSKPMHSKIVFSRDGNIWKLSTKEGYLHQLTNSGTDMHPDWSPDGRKIAFTRQCESDKEIYIMNADGSNQRNITKNGYSDYNPDWSPDGLKIAYTSTRKGNAEVAIVYPKSLRSRQLTNNEITESKVRWSSDGRAFWVISEGWLGINNVYKIDFSGRTLNSFWAVQGKEYTYLHKILNKVKKPNESFTRLMALNNNNEFAAMYSR